MNKSWKTGILIAILGIPVLAFLFLKIFGRNNFDLPYFFPEMDEEGEVIMVSGDTLFSTAPEFTLLDTKGDSVTIKNGSIKVINFFFSRCGTICPIANTFMAEVADNFKHKSDVQFYGITVDPKYDTPEILHTYSRALGIEGLNYELLTGDKKYIYSLCLDEFHLPVADASEYDPSITDIDQMFIHSDKVLLIDQEGYFRGIYSGTQKDEMDRLKLEIKVLLSHNENRD